MKKRLLALNLALVLLLTLMPTVALADGPVVLVPDEDGALRGEYIRSEESLDENVEFKYTPDKNGWYLIEIDGIATSSETLIAYINDETGESVTSEYSKSNCKCDNGYGDRRILNFRQILSIVSRYITSMRHLLISTGVVPQLHM